MQTLNDVERIVDRIEEEGYALPEARDVLARARAIQSSALQGPREHADSVKRIAHELAAGTLDVDTAIAQAVERAALAPATAPGHAPSPAAAILKRAVTRCVVLVMELVRAAGPRILDNLGTRVDDVVSETTDLAKKLPDGIANDQEAVKVGGVALERWARLNELADEWQRMASFARFLREIEAGDGHVAFRHPELRVAARERLHKALALAADITAGAEPTLLTSGAHAAIADQRLHERMEREAAERASGHVHVAGG